MLTTSPNLSRASLALAALLLCPSAWPSAAVSVADIVKRSAETNAQDFAEASHFNFKETDHVKNGTRTYQVSMIDGTPYQRLLEQNGKPLSAAQAAAEQAKQSQVTQQRRQQSAADRQARIAKYRHGQVADHAMMSQLTAAFDFSLVGEGTQAGFPVWILKATPKPGYQPPNLDAQVLPGMRGEMWIDQQTYEWVKVTAVVTRPVSIEGFLAQVEPGTRFEIEKRPVLPGVWQITHYSSHAQAKVFFLIPHAEQADERYFDFTRAE